MHRIVHIIYSSIFYFAKKKYRFSYRLIKLLLHLFSRLRKGQGVSDIKLCDEDIIVSLTTYGRRLEEVHLTIESIMCGEFLPNKIILCLEDGLKGEQLTAGLKRQLKRGLEIVYYKDIRSYKKLIPTLQNHPKDIIITIDDDVFYSSHLLKNLISSYQKDKHHIYANRVHEIILDEKMMPQKYLMWNMNVTDQKYSFRFMQTGVGGVLYPPGSLASEVFNEDVFMKFCKFGDDIWFYAMGLLNGYTVHKAYTDDAKGEDYIDLVHPKEEALSVKNTNQSSCRNDEQILNVFQIYKIPNIYKSYLSEETL